MFEFFVGCRSRTAEAKCLNLLCVRPLMDRGGQVFEFI